MKNILRKLIKESIAEMFEENKKPSIFQSTIYRLPSNKELEEVNDYKLNSDDVLSGFRYTIVGRGIMDDKNKQMIIQSIKMLSDLYPENNEYKKAIEAAKQIQPKFRSVSPTGIEPVSKI